MSSRSSGVTKVRLRRSMMARVHSSQECSMSLIASTFCMSGGSVAIICRSARAPERTSSARLMNSLKKCLSRGTRLKAVIAPQVRGQSYHAEDRRRATPGEAIRGNNSNYCTYMAVVGWHCTWTNARQEFPEGGCRRETDGSSTDRRSGGGRGDVRNRHAGPGPTCSRSRAGGPSGDQLFPKHAAADGAAPGLHDGAAGRLLHA